GPDGIREPGPTLLCGLWRPRHLTGCPGSRSDRCAITSLRPRNLVKLFSLRATRSCSRGGRWRAIGAAACHDRPCHSGCPVGCGDGYEPRRLALEQRRQPRIDRLCFLWRSPHPRMAIETATAANVSSPTPAGYTMVTERWSSPMEVTDDQDACSL